MRHMPHRFRYTAEQFVTYRIHVSILTFFIVLTTYFGATRRFSAEILLVSLSFALLMSYVYLVNKVTDAAEDAVNVKGGPIESRTRHSTLVAGLLCLFVPLAYLIPFVGNIGILLVYAVVALLGFLYSFPITVFGIRFRFKQVLGLKTTTSSLIWALPVFVSPFLLGAPLSPFWDWLFVLIFAATASIEIMWDVRDMRGDKQFGIHTIPNTLGLPAARTIAAAMLIVAAFAGYELRLSIYSGVALLASLGFVFATGPRRGKWFYHSIVFVWIIALALYLLV